MLLLRRRLKDRAPDRAMHQRRFGHLRCADWPQRSVISRLRMKPRFDGEISLWRWIEFGCGAAHEFMEYRRPRQERPPGSKARVASPGLRSVWRRESVRRRQEP